MKWRRRLPWLAALAVAFVVCVGPWRFEWIESVCGSGHLKASATAIESALGSLPSTLSATTFRAGAAKVELTDLAAGMPLAGYGSRAFRANSGVADPIFARAIVLETNGRKVAFVAVELLIVNRRLADETMAALGRAGSKLQRTNVYFGATHTHSAPGGYPSSLVERFGIGLSQPKVAAALAERMAAAVVKAEQDLHPAEWASSSVEAPADCIANRTKSSDPANRWLDLLWLRRADGAAPIAMLGVFSAHATSRSSHDDRVSGDYPGVFSGAMEKGWGGVGLFMAGSVGSMAPAGDVKRDQLADHVGTSLAKAAKSQIQTVKWSRETQLASVGVALPMPPPAVRMGGSLYASPLLGGTLIPATGWVQAVRVGDRVFLGAPCDYGGTLARQLRTAATNVTTVVTSFSGEYCGYVIPDAYYQLDKYEPRSMSLYGPRLGTYFQERMAMLANGLAR